MAFEKIEKKISRGFRLSQERSCPRLTVSRQKLGDRLIGVVSINHLLMNVMGWKTGDRLSLSIGTGADRGWLAIRQASDGHTIGSFGTGSKSACVKASNLFSHITDGSIFSRECKFRVVADTIFVELPAVFLAPEASEVNLTQASLTGTNFTAGAPAARQVAT